MSDLVELPCGFPSGCLLAATCWLGYVRSGCHTEVAGGAGSCSLQLWSTIKQAFTGFRELLTARLRVSPVVVPQPLFFFFSSTLQWTENCTKPYTFWSKGSPNLAKQLDHQDSKSKFLQIDLEKLCSESFSARLRLRDQLVSLEKKRAGATVGV